MMDYESDFVYMIPLNTGETQVFFEDIVHVPARIRGAFFSNKDSSKKIDFVIIDPKGHHVLDSYSKEYIFDFTTNLVGKFSFEFKSKKVLTLFFIKATDNNIIYNE